MSIFEVQHQPRAHRVIQRALASHRMPHAYLFAGPDGVGREMLAVRLAQVMLCQSPASVPTPADAALADEPPVAPGSSDRRVAASPRHLVESCQDACGECDDCRLVHAGTHPDLFVVHRQLNREHPDTTIRKQKALNISVEVIRHFVIDRVARRPMRGRAKFFIIREAERMSEAAQNSLLKTLEEPPPDTFIVLVTSAADRMLPTTKSRCQPVVFQPLPVAFVAQRLEALRPDTPADEREFVARHSGGSLGTALRLIDDGLFALKRAWGDKLVELLNPPRGFAPHLLAQPFINDAKTIGKQAAERDPDMSDTDATRVGLQALLAALAGFYQDAQRQAAGAAVEQVNGDQPRVIDAIVRTQPPARIIAALQQINQADAAISRNAALELTMETTFIELAHVAAGQPGRRIVS